MTASGYLLHKGLQCTCMNVGVSRKHKLLQLELHPHCPQMSTL